MSSNVSLADLPPSLLQIDEGPHMLRILTPMAAVVTLVVALRIGVRLYRRVGLGLDDWLILVSLVSQLRIPSILQLCVGTAKLAVTCKPVAGVWRA